MQRAAQIRPGPFSEADLLKVAYITQHVAGLPLALELAAAGIRTYSVAELEGRLRSSLNALSTTLRDVPERHRSMRAVSRLLAAPKALP